MNGNRSILLFLLLTFSCFLHGSENWDRVYLATYPRSGSHWVRFLFEEATHIATGSVYRDLGGVHKQNANANHMPMLFPWGGYCVRNGFDGNCCFPIQEEPVLIKTHFPFLEKRSHEPNEYEKVVVVIRNPLDTIYSQYVYEYPDQRGKTIPKTWAIGRAKTWRFFYNFWKDKPGVLLIRYEDLLANPYETLRRVLEAVGFKVSENDLERAIQKYPPSSLNGQHARFYLQDVIDLMSSELAEILDEFGY